MALYETAIRGVMLANGTVFYANVTNTGNKIKVNKPLVFRLAQNEQGQPQLQPQALLPLASEDDVMEIDKAHVVTTFQPDDNIVSAYQELTGAVLTPPTQKLIIP